MTQIKKALKRNHCHYCHITLDYQHTWVCCLCPRCHPGSSITRACIKYTRDHQIPRVLLPPPHPSDTGARPSGLANNRVSCCAYCNTSKGSLTSSEFGHSRGLRYHEHIARVERLRQATEKLRYQRDHATQIAAKRLRQQRRYEETA